MGKGGSGKGAAKGKGKKKITPEESGFTKEENLYVREPQFCCGISAPVSCDFQSRIEIGHIEKSKQGLLPRGEAKLEVLCTRQTLLGNPFRLHAEDEQMRNSVCDLYADFFENAMTPEATGLLLDIARNTIKRRGQQLGLIGKDWAEDVGSHDCEEFRQAFAALEQVTAKHGGSVRLLCHCAPLRCHTFSIASKLAERCAMPSTVSTSNAIYAVAGRDSNDSVSLDTEADRTSAKCSRWPSVPKCVSATDDGQLRGQEIAPLAATMDVTTTVPINGSVSVPVSSNVATQRRWGRQDTTESRT